MTGGSATNGNGVLRERSSSRFEVGPDYWSIHDDDPGSSAWMAPLPYPSTLAPLPIGRKPKTVPPPLSEADHQAPGPVRLDHGSVGAATFDAPREGDAGLEWHQPRSIRLQKMARRGTDAVKLKEVVPPALVFPSTRRRSLAPSQATPDQIAEASKRFLTTLPEVAHVPYALLRSPIVEAQQEAVKDALVEPWNPYEGNRIATTSAQNIYFAQSGAVGLVAFPTGELGQELNVSTLTVKVSRRVPPKEKFTPAVRPVASFLTPIQQIVSSPYQTINHEHFRKSHIAVRTVSHVHLIDLALRPNTAENEEPVVSSELLTVSREMTGGGRHVDIAMSPWERTRGVGISDDGSIWEFGMQNRDGVVYPRGKGQVSVALQDRLDRSFHRIDYGSTTFEVNVLSDQKARLLDLRAPTGSLPLFDLTGSTAYLTSLERKSSDARFSSNLLCVSTTESVSWLDKRMPGKAVVSWDHHRGFDRSLELVSLDDDDLSTVLLTSRRDNAVTAYTTALDSVESLKDPYLVTPPNLAELPREPSMRSRNVKADVIPLSRPIFDTRHGSSFFRHPSLPSDYPDVIFFELSSRGGVVARRMRLGAESEIELLDPFFAIPRIQNDWTLDVKRLADIGEADENINEAGQWDGDLERLKSVYEGPPYFFSILHNARSFKGLFSADAKPLLDRYVAAVDHLREPDTRHDTMLTSHDLAHYATSADESQQRSLFLSDSGIHPEPAQEKATFDLLGRAPIGQGAASSHSVASRIEALVGGPLATDASRLAKELWSAYGMPSHFKPSPSIDSTEEPRAQARYASYLLALDLSLASNIHSAKPVVPPPDVDPDDELERATQALSLYGDDGGGSFKKAALPPLHFGFVRPVPQKADRKGKGRASNGPADGPGASDDTVTGSTTSRSLMSAWLIGEDPREHRHVDLHGIDHARTLRRLEVSSAAAAAAFASSLPPTQSQGRHGGSSQYPQPPSISITPALPPPPAFSQTGRRLQPPTLATTHAAVPDSSLGPSHDDGAGGSRSLPVLRAHDSLPTFARKTMSSQAQPTYLSEDHDLGPQTQIMPGQYGGRPGTGGGAAKKAKKKRVGGF